MLIGSNRDASRHLPAREHRTRAVDKDQHVLPRGFVKIRHYGLHSASHATTRLETARRRLGPAETPTKRAERARDDGAELLLRLTGVDVRLCPACHAATER